MKNVKDIQYLSGNPHMHNLLKEELLCPSLLSWDELTYETCVKVHQEVQSHLYEKPYLFKLVHVYFLTILLLYKNHMPGWAKNWLFETVNPIDLISPISIPKAIHSNWSAVPALLFLNDTVHIRYFIIGYNPDVADNITWPHWAKPVLSRDTRKAVENAASVVTKIETIPSSSGFFCFPLILPNDCLQIRGSSMGLPLFLGFASVVSGQTVSDEIIATGQIDEQGKVEKVNSIEYKLQKADQEKFRLFFYPQNNLFSCEEKNTVAIPVENVRQAWILYQLYSPANAKFLQIFSGMLKNPVLFVKNIDMVPPQWLKVCAKKGYLQTIVDEVLQSFSLFSALTDHFERSVKNNYNEFAEALSEIIRIRKSRNTGRLPAALPSFRWASCNICLNNHLGRPAVAKSWKTIAETYLDYARKIDLTCAIDFFNFAFVSEHNRYHFSPALPGVLPKILEMLENQYAIQCDFGSPVHPTLGALYGTIAQNFGFCGPAWLTYTLSYAKKAAKALGETLANEFKHEWLRPYNYTTYALLDAGENYFSQAKKHLFTYLETSDYRQTGNKISDMTQWQHALTARFFADTKDPGTQRYYEEVWPVRKQLIKEQHPWQLWAFNMGRIAFFLDKRQETIDWFRQSLDLCMENNLGPTVHAMALLPLAGLRKLGNLVPEKISPYENKIRISIKELSAPHFSILNHVGFEEALDKVYANPEKLFPFSYR